jgi:pimeloyl-ACP methyl ester carboxylesterase
MRDRISGAALCGVILLCGCGDGTSKGRDRNTSKEAASIVSEKSGMSAIRSAFVELGGGNVHYFVDGRESGRSIVLLHGNAFTAQTWRDLGTIDALVKAEYQVHAVDLPEYGLSGATDASVDQWLGLLLDKLQIKAPVIVSPSMSGKYSLPLVTERPDRVSGFIAIAPVGIPTHREKLDRITAPVLALWGEKDNIVPIANADLLVTAVKNGRKVIVPGGSHAPYMSNTETFHQELLKFLTELAPSK